MSKVKLGVLQFVLRSKERVASKRKQATSIHERGEFETRLV